SSEKPINEFQSVSEVLNASVEDDVKNLFTEVRYIIVDSLESSSNAEVDFITEALDNTLQSYIYFDYSRDYSVFNNVDIDYINEKIISKIKPKEENIANR
ncbi:hypothetical protein QOS_2434, partial [Clostridioides difficile Y184]